MNVFDFDFFMVIVRHKRVNVQLCIQILETMFSVAQSDIFFNSSAIAIITTIIERFNKDPYLLQNLSAFIKSSLDVIEDQEN